jgi:hypothetical protein
VNAAIINTIKHCAVTKWRQRIVTAAASGTPVNLTTVSVSALISNDGTATATASAHGFLVGDQVTIAGATPTEYNGHVEILTVPTANTFTYRVTRDLATAATGTLTAKADLWFRTARCRGLKAARTANTGIVYLGLDATNDTQPFSIAASAELVLEAPTGARLNLADLWVDVATNADGVVIWWC